MDAQVPTLRDGYAALRKGRISAAGQVYFVTTVVKGRKPVFREWAAASVACRVLNREVGGSRFVAWVLMPDHFHGLLQLGDDMTLAQVLQLYKGRVAIGVNRQLQRAGPLWQDGFHEHAMRREEDLEQIARYIVDNPLRAGIVASRRDYPYWNAEWLWNPDWL